MPLLRSFERRTVTAGADTPFQIIGRDKWYSMCDIFVYDNAAYVGDVSGQDVLVNAGDIYSFSVPVNICDFFFKNVTAGSNTRVVVAGTPMTQKQADEAGLGIVIS